MDSDIKKCIYLTPEKYDRMLLNKRLQKNFFDAILNFIWLQYCYKYFIFYIFIICFISVSYYGCGVYTFNGSTLPSHIKTVDIPLFLNNSLEPGIADEITHDLSEKILSDNQLRVISNRGDATIYGDVKSYVNEPYTYGASEARKADIDQYIVRISATIDFVDNKKGNSIFKGDITGEGIYEFEIKNESDGREMARQDIVKKIIEKSIQSW